MHDLLCLILLSLLLPLNWTLELSYPIITSLGGACPPRDTCSSLTDPDGDHLWGGRTCECGPHCRTRSACCIDAIDTNGRVHSEKTDDSEACRGVAGGFSVWMVDGCPDGDSLASREKCEEPPGTIHQEDPLMSAPVTSKTSGRTYRNYLCALCHQDTETAVVWDISLQGLTKEQANQTASDLLEKLAFDPAHGSWGLLVHRNRTRNPKKITEDIPTQNREAFRRSDGKEVSQKTIDDELETIDEKDGRGKFIHQDSISTGNKDIIEFSVTRFIQKPHHSMVVSHQTIALIPIYSTLFGFNLNSRGGYQKWVGNGNFRTKEPYTQSSSRLEVDFKPHALSPQREERFTRQTPADVGSSRNRNIFGGTKEQRPLFEEVEEPFGRVSDQKSETVNGDLHQRNPARYKNPDLSAIERRVPGIAEFSIDSAPAQNGKERQYKGFEIVQESVSEPLLKVRNTYSKTYESGSRESVQINPTPDHHEFYSPSTEHHGIDSGRTYKINDETGPKSETSEKGPHLTVENPIIRDEPPSPTFQKLNIKFSVPAALRKTVTKCFPNMIRGCPDDYADRDTRDACASYYAPVRLRVAGTRTNKFRNFHCGLCHNATADDGFCVLEQAPRRKSKFSFAMLLDVNGYDDEEKEEERGGRCDEGQVFDPFYKKCRNLKCGRPGFVVKGKKCVKA